MSKDASFSYIHLDNPSHILYIEKWKDELIPFDDIDTSTLFDTIVGVYPNFFFDEEDDNSLMVNSMNFGLKSLKNKRKLLKERVWNDSNVFEKFSGPPNSNCVDKTILSPLYTKSHNANKSNTLGDLEDDEELTVGEFLTNGYNLTANLRRLQLENPNILTSNHSNDSFLGSRSNSFNQTIQTPRITKTRQPSNDKNFQTPIGRITR